MAVSRDAEALEFRKRMSRPACCEIGTNNMTNMTRGQFLCLFLVAGISLICLAGDATEDDEGFVSIFNGNTFAE